MRKLRVSLLASVFLLLSGVVEARAAQTQFPDTLAGHQGAAWLEAFNTGKRESYRDFLQKNFPSRAQQVDQEMGFREMTGGFELRKLEESTPTKLVALVQERLSDQFGRLTLEVEAGEPHHIVNLDLRAIPRPAEFPLPHMSEDELMATLRKKLEEDAAADRFAGSALVAKNGKPVFAQAYGVADREHKTPNTLKTRFRIGSMNRSARYVLWEPGTGNLPGHPVGTQQRVSLPRSPTIAASHKAASFHRIKACPICSQSRTGRNTIMALEIRNR